MKLIKYYLALISLLFVASFCAISQVLPIDSTSMVDSTILSDFKIVTKNLESTVALEIYIKHPERIASMTVDRNANYSDIYTTILNITEEDLKNIKNHILNLTDKYPLPSTQNVYYRLMVEDKEGIVRYYPPTEMRKAN